MLIDSCINCIIPFSEEAGFNEAFDMDCCIQMGCFCIRCARDYYNNEIYCHRCHKNRSKYVVDSCIEHYIHTVCNDCVEKTDIIRRDICVFVDEYADKSELGKFRDIIFSNKLVNCIWFHFMNKREEMRIIEENRELNKKNMIMIHKEIEEVIYHPDNIIYMVENGYFSDKVKIEGEIVVFSDNVTIE